MQSVFSRARHEDILTSPLSDINIFKKNKKNIKPDKTQQLLWVLMSKNYIKNQKKTRKKSKHFPTIPLSVPESVPAMTPETTASKAYQKNQKNFF